jgi:hypothetical protein
MGKRRRAKANNENSKEIKIVEEEAEAGITNVGGYKHEYQDLSSGGKGNVTLRIRERSKLGNRKSRA